MAVPADTPETMPVPAIVAMPVLPDDQVPPLVALANVVTLPTHTCGVPVIAVESEDPTVIVAVL